MQPFLAAAVQLRAGSDKNANLARAEELVAQAASRGAVLIILPEVFSWRGAEADEVSGAESIPVPTSAACASWARRHRVHLLAGSLLEGIEGEPRTYNTSLLFSPAGEVLARYRKAHLFDVEIPGQVSVRESDSRLRGSEIVTAATDLGTIGLTVCYDLRFPELFRGLTLAGATLVTVPSAFTFPTGAAHWEPLLRARAIENQIYVIAANQFGRTPRGTLDFGHSMIVDPWGTVLARAAEGEGVVLAEIDPAYQQLVRRQLPCLQHVQFAR
jgi:predicted amidohydrolase